MNFCYDYMQGCNIVLVVIRDKEVVVLSMPSTIINMPAINTKSDACSTFLQSFTQLYCILLGIQLNFSNYYFLQTEQRSHHQRDKKFSSMMFSVFPVK